MKITVKLFAHLRAAAGSAQVSVDLPGTPTAADAALAITTLYPAVDITGAMVAVNARYAKASTPLADGDVVALLPPVSGG